MLTVELNLKKSYSLRHSAGTFRQI